MELFHGQQDRRGRGHSTRHIGAGSKTVPRGKALGCPQDVAEEVL